MTENNRQSPDPEQIDWSQFVDQLNAAHDSYTDGLQDVAAQEALYTQAQEVFFRAAGEHAETLGLPSGLDKLPGTTDELDSYTQEESDALLRAAGLVAGLTQLPGNPNADRMAVNLVGDALYGLEDRNTIDAWLAAIRESCAHYEVNLDTALGNDPELTMLQAVADTQRFEEQAESWRIPPDLRDARYALGRQAATGLLEELGISPDHDNGDAILDLVASLCATDPGHPFAQYNARIKLEKLSQVLTNTTAIPNINGVIEYINHTRTEMSGSQYTEHTLSMNC